MYLLSLYFQDPSTLGFTPLQAGLATLPATVGLVVVGHARAPARRALRQSSRDRGRLRPHGDRIRGDRIRERGLALRPLRDPSSGDRGGDGPLQRTATSVATASVPPAEVGSASGISNMARYVGAAVATAIAATIYGSVSGFRIDAGAAQGPALASGSGGGILGHGRDLCPRRDPRGELRAPPPAEIRLGRRGRERRRGRAHGGAPDGHSHRVRGARPVAASVSSAGHPACRGPGERVGLVRDPAVGHREVDAHPAESAGVGRPVQGRAVRGRIPPLGGDRRPVLPEPPARFPSHPTLGLPSLRTVPMWPQALAGFVLGSSRSRTAAAPCRSRSGKCDIGIGLRQLATRIAL